MRYFILFVVLAWLASCKSPQIITERIVTDTTIIREIPRIIEIPGATISSPSINIDSLVSLIQSGISPETITNTLTREDPETKMRIGIMLDALGNLTAICEQQDRTIELMEQEITRLIKETTNTTKIHQPTIWQRTYSAISFISIFMLIAILAYLFIRTYPRS